MTSILEETATLLARMMNTDESQLFQRPAIISCLPACLASVNARAAAAVLFHALLSPLRITAAVALVTAAAISQPHCRAEDGEKFTGKFLLFERPADADALDAIEFLAGGNCLVDQDGHAGIPATYYTTQDGRIVIESKGTKKASYDYRFEFLKQSLTFAGPDDSALIYVHVPNEPHPKLAEITGMFLMHSQFGDSVTEITPDLHFRVRMRELDGDNHRYTDVALDGKCTYVGGVVTYFPEHSNDPHPDKYLRDFLLSRDENGIWAVDPNSDAVILAKLVKTLELPPIPEGYKLDEAP